jgi:TRAP-type C4-dicarboxylate transport system permease large subunit
VFPFVLLMILGLGIIIAFPEIALWLPGLYQGN